MESDEIDLSTWQPFSKSAEKTHSVGAVYMACLNLPAEIRYKPENIYLASIIPGPREPSVDQINDFLRPLIDELLSLWRNGVKMTKTASFAGGCLVRAAVIPLVADLPAVRKVAGFAHYAKKTGFCSFCPLDLDNINDLDRTQWTRKTYAEHLGAAIRFRDAATLSERDAIFEQFGVRWSELLRLPYWDPTRYALIDAMHNLYLGELQAHCRSVLGINVNQSSKTKPHTPEQQAENLRLVSRAIERGSRSALNQVRKCYLVAVAWRNNLLRTKGEKVKADYITALLNWVSTIITCHIRSDTILRSHEFKPGTF